MTEKKLKKLAFQLLSDVWNFANTLSKLHYPIHMPKL